MSENTEYSYKTADQASANLVHLVSLLKKKLLAILIFTFSVMILTGIYIFSLPRTWKSETILLPESSANSVSGNLGSIAAIAGIKMNTGSNKKCYLPWVLSKSIRLYYIPYRITQTRNNRISPS